MDINVIYASTNDEWDWKWVDREISGRGLSQKRISLPRSKYIQINLFNQSDK